METTTCGRRFGGWLAASVLLLTPLASAAEPGRFLVYYSDQAPVEAFEAYDLLVLDSRYHPPLEPLAHQGKTLLGYLSLGEINRDHPHFRAVQADGILLDENPHWKGSYRVDLRSRAWTRRVVEHLIPEILRQGFDGLFLDTLDDAPHLERLDPERFRGMTEAAARLVRTIRLHYPRAVIMVNRAYELLPGVERQIDLVLGESVRADYDFDAKRYFVVDDALYRTQVELLRQAKTRRPDLRVLTLDYWDPDDADGIAAIYREQRANGFEPYVATVELDRIVREPRP